MGNQKIDNHKQFELRREYDIKFIEEIRKKENSVLIKMIKGKDKLKYFNKIKIIQEKNSEIMIIKGKSYLYKLNLIDINKKKNNNNHIIDCIILENDNKDIKGFENLKNIWFEKYKKNKKTNLVYLIDIKNESPEEKAINDDIKIFAFSNDIDYYTIANENDAEGFLEYLLRKLEEEETKRFNTFKTKNNPIKNSYKVTFVGPSGIGAKTSLIDAIMGNSFNQNINPTTTCTRQIKKIEIKNKKIKLRLWDNIGQEKFRSLTKIYLKDSDCIVIGFDVTNESSFKDIKEWYLIVKEYLDIKLIYLIGNKIDLIDQRVISENEARNLAKELNLRYFETSCLSGVGIQNFMNDLTREIIKY